MLVPRLGFGSDESERRLGEREAVGDERTLGVIEPQPQPPLAADPGEEDAALGTIGHAQRGGGDLRFGAGEAEALGDQLVAVAVEIEQASPPAAPGQ